MAWTTHNAQIASCHCVDGEITPPASGTTYGRMSQDDAADAANTANRTTWNGEHIMVGQPAVSQYY